MMLKGGTDRQSILDRQHRWLVSSDWQAPMDHTPLHDLIDRHNDVHRLAEDLMRLRGQGLEDKALARRCELDGVLDAMPEALRKFLSATHAREA